jgi:hypothetical protein
MVSTEEKRVQRVYSQWLDARHSLISLVDLQEDEGDNICTCEESQQGKWRLVDGLVELSEGCAEVLI